ncbi:MAG TPA: FAD-dependent oxidoreductase [Thermoleophilaceae bacterium]|jgi:oxygen-dependent protoporphyrinogen oxidase
MSFTATAATTERGGLGTVIVVGGGWTGIAAAWHLRALGARPVVLDRAAELGGRSAAGPELGGREITFGGKNIGRRYERFRAFVAEVAEPRWEHFGINSSRVGDNGRIHTVDSERGARSALALLRNVGARDLATIARCAWYVRGDRSERYVGGRAFDRLAERHGDPTLDRVFGPRARSVLIRPMTVRMNGAEPDEVHLGTFGTNLAGVMETYDQLENGFGEVLDGFRRSVRCELGATVESLAVEDGRVVGVNVRRADDDVEPMRCDAVVLAVPAPASAELVAPHLPDVARDLREVSYHPAAVAVVRYSRPIFAPEVRALLLPPDSPASNAGAYGVDNLDLVRYTFSGRASRAALAGDFDPEALVAEAERRLARVLPVSARDRVAIAARRWDAALCAYGPQHSRRVVRVRDRTRTLPGLHLTGDWARGGTIEACFRGGEECAGDVAAALRVAAGATSDGGLRTE